MSIVGHVDVLLSAFGCNLIRPKGKFVIFTWLTTILFVGHMTLHMYKFFLSRDLLYDLITILLACKFLLQRQRIIRFLRSLESQIDLRFLDAMKAKWKI